MTIRTLSAADAGEIGATVCIIGAGIAGLLMARRLAKTGKRVVVIESGLRKFDQAIHDLNTVEDPTGRFHGALTGRYRGLGGSSVQWGGRMIPLTPGDYGARPEIGVEAWPLDPAELEAYRAEIERLFQVDDTSFEEAVLDVLDRERLIPRNDPDIVLRYPKWPSFKLCNVAFLLRDQIENDPSLDIWLGATVNGFELDTQSGRLAAVTARNFAGDTLTVRADHFVLTAGTIESTRILLMLDAASGGRAFAECDALGRYFQDHLGGMFGRLDIRDAYRTNRWFGYHFIGSTRRNLHLELSPRAQRASGVASGFSQVIMDLPEESSLGVIKNFLRGLQRGTFDLPMRGALRLARDAVPMMRTGYWRYVRHQLYMPSEVGLTLHAWFEQVPHADSRIVLSDQTDAIGMPMARIEWRIGEEDERTLRATIDHTRAYWTRSGLDAVCPIIWRPEVSQEGARLTDLCADISHPSGSARMGIDSRHSVVDPDLRCHHVSNMTVASAAVFPSSGSANPTYTIMLLALRAADRLAAEIA